MSECKINTLSSRTCERGTECCEVEHGSALAPATGSAVELPHFYAYSGETPPRKLWDEDDMRDYAAAVLKRRLVEIRDAIENIAVVKGEDSGVILLSDEGPTKWDEQRQVNVYQHEHFSPLGDAMVALHRMTDPPNDPR